MVLSLHYFAQSFCTVPGGSMFKIFSLILLGFSLSFSAWAETDPPSAPQPGSLVMKCNAWGELSGNAKFEVVDYEDYRRFRDNLIGAQVNVRVLHTGGEGKTLRFTDDSGHEVVANYVPGQSLVARGEITSIYKQDGQIVFEIQTSKGKVRVAKSPADNQVILMRGHLGKSGNTAESAGPELVFTKETLNPPAEAPLWKDVPVQSRLVEDRTEGKRTAQGFADKLDRSIDGNWEVVNLKDMTSDQLLQLKDTVVTGVHYSGATEKAESFAGKITMPTLLAPKGERTEWSLQLQVVDAEGRSHLVQGSDLVGKVYRRKLQSVAKAEPEFDSTKPADATSRGTAGAYAGQRLPMGLRLVPEHAGPSVAEAPVRVEAPALPPLLKLTKQFGVGDRHYVTLRFEKYDSSKYKDEGINTVNKAHLFFDSSKPDTVKLDINGYRSRSTVAHYFGELALNREASVEGKRVYENLTTNDGYRLVIHPDGEMELIDGVNPPADASGKLTRGTAVFTGDIQKAKSNHVTPAQFVRANQYQELEIPISSNGAIDPRATGGRAQLIFRDGRVDLKVIETRPNGYEYRRLSFGSLPQVESSRIPDTDRVYEDMQVDNGHGYRVSVKDNGYVTVESGINKGPYLTSTYLWRTPEQKRQRDEQREREWQRQQAREREVAEADERARQAAEAAQARQAAAQNAVFIPGLGYVSVAVSIGQISVGQANVAPQNQGPAIIQLPGGGQVSISLGQPTIRVGR